MTLDKVYSALISHYCMPMGFFKGYLEEVEGEKVSSLLIPHYSIAMKLFDGDLEEFTLENTCMKSKGVKFFNL
ncbi:MAG TPA: hypothetical protein ENI29_05160 [bacterium]|nr:hypothetical protein [bacterium]